MLQVMTGNDNSSPRLLGVVRNQMLQHQLTRGVEEVEGLVENHRLGLAK